MSMIKIVKQDDFDEKMKRHNEGMETNKDYQETMNTLSFPVGTRLELVIDVTDEFFSQSIFALLHGKLEGAELLGFKVDEIILFPETKAKNQVKAALQKMIYDLDNPSSQIISTISDGTAPFVVQSTTMVSNLNIG